MCSVCISGSIVVDYTIYANPLIVNAHIIIDNLNRMDNLANFKMEIESMFEKSFQELSQKNNLNRA